MFVKLQLEAFLMNSRCPFQQELINPEETNCVRDPPSPFELENLDTDLLRRVKSDVRF